ncbi:lymphocyte antigen 6D-like [Centropristis striata]|uniref:lymphocyte antigen 6D-like n=1 Tax=Centropristis striata TaxID=184440 RepID=UPI0027E20AF5|nr:lymphocyte antigen 6D-like [Centropristis striata]
MQFYGALVLLITLSAACGLKCYSCTGKGCTNSVDCPPLFDRCSSIEVNGVVTKSCMSSIACGDTPLSCCQTDLCNSAISTGSSVLLMMVSSALITLFL